MYTRELWDLGEKYVQNFIGVYPLDKIQSNITPTANFIVNTHTANLPGEHWIAVSYLNNGKVYAFDSFGVYYPRILRQKLQHLKRRSYPVQYNTIQFQNIFEKTCGLYCIAWLIYINTIHKS